ncbi:MAG: DUF3526 domain-containing protein [Cytophagales bacterium]|nr:MAG: DUF3526 domain-containing protein [Cytophagales bacterium]
MTINLIAKHVWKSAGPRSALTSRGIVALLVLMAGLMLYALVTGVVAFREEQTSHAHHRQEARRDWLSNPDKHPHRMAHFGHYAIREKEPLSLFDRGMERFMGNMVYLEAHRQNSVNFSEAGFSTGLLRFGEISLAMLLQLLVPLLVFFLGFDSITAERERGTLAMLMSQGVSWRQLLLGKWLGLSRLMLLFFVPIMVVTWALVLILPHHPVEADDIIRLVLLTLTYLLYLLLFCGIAVLVSARSRTGKTALVTLIGLWLMLTIVLPRASQALGVYLYPAPSQAQFVADIQADIMKQGDSHNPNDPHYKALKDSVLTAYRVDSVTQLPFNFGGLVMTEGERISAGIYDRHFARLQTIYADQNRFSKALAWVNPYMAIRSLSMLLAHTDYGSYLHFQQQAEAYRYALAQKMNELQIKYIAARANGPNRISRANWQNMPDFSYEPQSVSTVLGQEAVTIGALIGWLLLLLGVGYRQTKTLTVTG